MYLLDKYNIKQSLTFIKTSHLTFIKTSHLTLHWVRDGAVGCGTALQAGRSRVRFPVMSLEFFIDIILDGLGDFNIGGQIIQTVKYADDLVLMAKEEKVLQGMIDKLTEI